jgi:hypothetical protein
MFTQEQLNTITAWEARLNQASIIFDPNCPGNVSIVLGYIANNLRGDISENNLNIAMRACHAALRFLPGHEPHDPHADAKAKADADARSLEAARQREAKTRAGINSDQTQIRTELDRYELNKPKLAANSDELAKIALKDLTNDAFLQEANDIIVKHRGPTHGRTAAQQEILRTERDRLIKAKATPEQIRDGVVRKQDSFRNDSVR